MSEVEVFMSIQEAERLHIIRQVQQKLLKPKQAAKKLGVCTRQIHRLVKTLNTCGPNALVSKKRGQSSNHQYSNNVRQKVQNLIQEKYIDFGPTLIAEMLSERDGLSISKETIRLWMIETNLWHQHAKQCQIHQPRDKHACYGSLVQIDGSPHDWFEGRSAPCTLIVFVDDATSKIQLMRFFPAETTFAYFNMMQLYLERYGLPCSLYSDKHGIFRVNKVEPISGTGLTQFGRAMKTLTIELIYAHSPQAKGCVERKHQLLQDRLVKMMRLDRINNIEMANGHYLDQCTEKFNNQFAIHPSCDINLHRTCNDLSILDDLFTLQHDRKISKNLTISYKGDIYKIKQPDRARRLYQATVTICEHESGEISILHKGQRLPYELYQKGTKIHNAIKTRKEITAHRLSHMDEQPKKIWIPPVDHPWRLNNFKK